jgi:hypothetical protein
MSRLEYHDPGTIAEALPGSAEKIIHPVKLIWKALVHKIKDQFPSQAQVIFMGDRYPVVPVNVLILVFIYTKVNQLRPAYDSTCLFIQIRAVHPVGLKTTT